MCAKSLNNVLFETEGVILMFIQSFRELQIVTECHSRIFEGMIWFSLIEQKRVQVYIQNSLPSHYGFIRHPSITNS
jgi:translation initiation factor 2B subunit (eIF-2B alpha/beta/delta family)